MVDGTITLSMAFDVRLLLPLMRTQCTSYAIVWERAGERNNNNNKQKAIIRKHFGLFIRCLRAEYVYGIRMF